MGTTLMHQSFFINAELSTYIDACREQLPLCAARWPVGVSDPPGLVALANLDHPCACVWPHGQCVEESLQRGKKTVSKPRVQATHNAHEAKQRQSKGFSNTS